MAEISTSQSQSLDNGYYAKELTIHTTSREWDAYTCLACAICSPD